MTRMIYCQKLGIEAEGMAFPPFQNDLGHRIYESISEKAWNLWLNHQTMLINEYKLSMLDTKAREFLQKEMENFLFAGGSQKPPGFIPQNS